MQRLGRVKLLPEKAVRNSNAGYAVEAGALRGGRVKGLIMNCQSPLDRLTCTDVLERVGSGIGFDLIPSVFSPAMAMESTPFGLASRRGKRP